MKKKGTELLTPVVDADTSINTQSSGGGSDAQSFQSLYEQMYQIYAPQTVDYTPLSGDALASQLATWLRPTYDAAIANRQAQTQRANGDLDADAWSRGMGSSTYVTDVKGRSAGYEARDVASLEASYSSVLAEHLYEALSADTERKTEIDMFNAEQSNNARAKAYAAAQTLYAAQGGGGGGGGGGDDTTKQKPASTLQSAILQYVTGGDYAATLDALSPNEIDSILSRMTPHERALLYGGEGGNAKLRADILNSVGTTAYNKLQNKYPAGTSRKQDANAVK